MDKTDLKILRILQADATVPIAEVARQVNLSPTPCWNRIRKLENDGVITSRVALVDPVKVGLGLTVFVAIEAGEHSLDWIENFRNRLQNMPEVMEVFRLAGDVDYLLRVVVSDMTAYDAFYTRLIHGLTLKSVTSRFSMERLAGRTVLPL